MKKNMGFKFFKNLIVIILLLLPLIQVYPGGGDDESEGNESTQTNESGDYSTWESSQHGMRIKYPSNWEKLEGQYNTIVLFRSPKEDENDKFQENLNLLTQDLSSQPTTLNRYVATNIRSLRGYIQSFNLIENKQIQVSGQQGIQLIFSGTHGQFQIKFIQIYTIKDNKAYIITFAAEENKFDAFLATAQKMISSFEIIQ